MEPRSRLEELLGDEQGRAELRRLIAEVREEESRDTRPLDRLRTAYRQIPPGKTPGNCNCAGTAPAAARTAETAGGGRGGADAPGPDAGPAAGAGYHR